MSEVVEALHRSWRPGSHQTSSMLLASDGSLLSFVSQTDYGLDFVYELYVTETYSYGCDYHAVIIDATGFHLAYNLHRQQGDPEAPMFQKYGESDRLEYFSDSLDMIYSWVSRVLHTLRREAEGR